MISCLSLWGPTPLIKGRCPEGTEGIGTVAPTKSVTERAIYPRTTFSEISLRASAASMS